jgi:hypothetical protein
MLKAKTFYRGCAFLMLLFGPVVLAWFDKPAGAAITIVAVGLAIVLSDIERFESVKGAGFAATMRKVEAVIDKQTERPASASESNDVAAPQPLDPEHKNRQVLEALDKSNFVWRTFDGLLRDTGLLRPEVVGALGVLVSRGHAQEAQNRKGAVWSLTPNGRDALSKFRRE